LIDITKLNKTSIDRMVIYERNGITEYGYIKNYNDKFIFVMYTLRLEKDKTKTYLFPGETSKATDPNDLSFI